MRKPRCYLVNTKDLDMSGAQVYGDVVNLYDKYPSNFFNTSTQAYYLKQKLVEAQSSDYLVMAGNLVLTIIVFGILYERFGFVNILLYDIRNNTYVPRVIPRHQLVANKEDVNV